MWENILIGLAGVFTPANLLIIVGGLVVGIILGVLPGFSVTMAVAVFVPFSYALEPDTALLLLSGVYCGGVYAGCIPAILLGIPGSPASAPTAFEGRACTQRGEAGRALAMCTLASTWGGFLSSLCLLFLAPVLAVVALRVGPPEQAMIAIFGLSVVCVLSFGNMAKGLLVGFFSLLIACIGMDPQVGFPRFTFGSVNLVGGVSLVPILIGLFSFPEIFAMLEKREETFVKAPNPGKLIFKMSDLYANVVNLIRSGIIGLGIGVIPAAGPDIGAFIAYNEAKKSSKHPEMFNHGALDGMVAAETANSAVTGSSLVPLFTLGIPGSAPAALFLGAMMIHGLRPGSALFTQNARIVYTLMVGFVILNIVMFFMGLFFCKFASYVLLIPKSVLATSIVILATVGAYATDKNMFDVVQMYIAGVIGYIMVKNNFPLSPVALALLLGKLLEQAISQTAVMYPDNLFMMFTRPLTIVFGLLVVISFVWPFAAQAIKTKKGRKEA